MMQWFDSPAHWYVIGFAGQVAFGSRFVVQWLDSERQKKVSIPVAFWYLSITGVIAQQAYALLQKDQVIALLPEYHCYAIDLRGHGRSSKPAPPYDWRFFGEDVAAVGAALATSGRRGQVDGPSMVMETTYSKHLQHASVFMPGWHRELMRSIARAIRNRRS